MKKFLKEYDLSNKDVIVASINAGWVGHSLKDYEKLLPNSNIKDKIDIVYGSEENERHDLKISYTKIDKWIQSIK